MLPNISLRPNDKVGLVCTGSICLQADHPQITEIFLRERYNLHSIFKHDTVQAIDPAERAEIFLEYLFNPDVKLIAAIRGGEGTADILPFVHQHYKKIKLLSPKFLLGFSDFTALLVYFAKYYQWPVIHGPSPLQFALNKVDKQTEEMTMHLLFGHSQKDTMTLTPLNDLAKVSTLLQAELMGGCLSLIDISVKDIWEMETKNKILFFEDVGEKAHKIIRSLKYFSRIGLFQSIKAIIFGDFNAEPIGYDTSQQEYNRVNIMKILKSFAEHQPFPVLQTNHFGHGKVNWPLVYSSLYFLQLGNEPILYKGVT
jgi:muramoyltetrapeptide carboxypeptidase